MSARRPAGGAREAGREALAGLKGPLPRVVCLVGGDAVLAAEVLEQLLARASSAGFDGFNHDVVHASEVKLRDLASRLEELPLLASERVVVVKGAEALLKNKAEDLARLWPGPDSATVLLLVAADDGARPARKSAGSWRDVLPAHALRLGVGAPTAEDAARWGRRVAADAQVAVDDEAWQKAFRRARGDGARLRTEIELLVLSALSGRPVASLGHRAEPTLEEAAEEVRAAIMELNATGAWAAAERYRSLGGSMDSRGADWVRGIAEQLLRSDSPGRVEALRALSTFQLRWRREVGTARQVLEKTGLELALAAARRGGRRAS